MGVAAGGRLSPACGRLVIRRDGRTSRCSSMTATGAWAVYETRNIPGDFTKQTLFDFWKHPIRPCEMCIVLTSAMIDTKAVSWPRLGRQNLDGCTMRRRCSRSAVGGPLSGLSGR